MKKLYILSFIYLLIILIVKSNQIWAYDDDYLSYKEFNMSSGELICNWSQEEYDSYLKKVSKKKFSGWNTYEVSSRVPVDFVIRTINSFYNQSYTGIDYSFDLVESETTKTSISVRGSLSTKISGKIKKFSTGLNAELKIDSEWQTIKEIKKSEKIKLTVDPKTKMQMIVRGSGRLTNGVAKEYCFWIECSSGAYEYFVISDVYTYIEKLFIW